MLIHFSLPRWLLALSFALGIQRSSLDAAELRANTAASNTTPPAAATLTAYRAELTAFRGEFGGSRALPDVRFFLFSMGQRAKLLYCDGRLTDARSGNLRREWKVKSDLVVPSDYLVSLETADGATVRLREDETGNLDQIRDWALGLKEVFDRDNGGETEANNPGQALLLISLVADKNHPLVPEILAAVKAFETNGPAGQFIQGRSDFAAHPANQTKWLKYGLRSLGLPDPYVVPAAASAAKLSQQ